MQSDSRQQLTKPLFYKAQITHAGVAELADALDSGSSGRNPVEVRFLSSALLNLINKYKVETRIRLPVDGRQSSPLWN